MEPRCRRVELAGLDVRHNIARLACVLDDGTRRRRCPCACRGEAAPTEMTLRGHHLDIGRIRQNLARKVSWCEISSRDTVRGQRREHGSTACYVVARVRASVCCRSPPMCRLLEPRRRGVERAGLDLGHGVARLGRAVDARTRLARHLIGLAADTAPEIAASRRVCSVKATSPPTRHVAARVVPVPTPVGILSRRVIAQRFGRRGRAGGPATRRRMHPSKCGHCRELLAPSHMADARLPPEGTKDDRCRRLLLNDQRTS